MPGTSRGVGLLDFVYRRVPALGALRTYQWTTLRADLLAGLTVATVAVPQAMAYGLLAGVPAEHGLYAAIVMTGVGALFASSRQLVNGPTNVLSIAVFSALAHYPADQKIHGMVALSLLIGAFQTLIPALRLGDLTRYISHSVVVGFTAGASALLVLDQVRNLFGWKSRGGAEDHFLVRLYETWSQAGAPHGLTTAIGVGTMISILALRWFKRRVGWKLFPELLTVVVGMSAVVGYYHLDQRGVAVVGSIPRQLPGFAVPQITAAEAWDLSGTAMAIGTLGLLEALAMAKNLAAISKEKLDLNQTCLSEGVANVAGSFFQAIPGSGSLTRSAINQQAGAQTQWAGVFSAVAVAAIVFAFAPYAQFVPRASLAGLLMVSAIGMIDWRALWFHVRATQFDAIIVGATAFAAIGVSVEFCILIGVLASFLLAVPRAGRVTLTEFVVDPSGVVRERGPGDQPDPRVPIFGLEGELFFGSTIALEEHLAAIDARSDETVVLRVKRLRNPDAVGLYDLEQFVRAAQARGVRVYLAGVPADLLQGLSHSGILSELEEDQVFRERERRGTATADAIRAAYQYLERRDLAVSAKVTPAPTITHVQD